MSDAVSFPSPAMKILILANLFALSLFAAIYGYTLARETRQKISAFATDSTVVSGIVTNWEITNVARSPDYWLDVTFETKDGTVHNVSANVQEDLFHHLRIGGSVQVTYVRSRPEWFYVADEVPTDKQAVALDWLFRLGAVASVLCAFGLSFKLFTGGKGAPLRASPLQTEPRRLWDGGPARLPRVLRAPAASESARPARIGRGGADDRASVLLCNLEDCAAAIRTGGAGAAHLRRTVQVTGLIHDQCAGWRGAVASASK